MGFGAVAQLGERLVRNEKVAGSIPVSSTIMDNSRTGLLEIYLYNGTFGLRLNARDILKQ